MLSLIFLAQPPNGISFVSAYGQGKPLEETLLFKTGGQPEGPHRTRLLGGGDSCLPRHFANQLKKQSFLFPPIIQLKGECDTFEDQFYDSEKKALERTRQLHEEHTLNTYIAPKRMALYKGSPAESPVL